MQNVNHGYQKNVNGKMATYKLLFISVLGMLTIGWNVYFQRNYKQTQIRNSEYDQEIQTNPWHHQEEPHNNHKTPGRQTKQSNQLSLFPIEMIAKLEWTQSNTQQNIEQLQNPTVGVTINNL